MFHFDPKMGIVNATTINIVIMRQMANRNFFEIQAEMLDKKTISTFLGTPLFFPSPILGFSKMVTPLLKKVSNCATKQTCSHDLAVKFSH